MIFYFAVPGRLGNQLFNLAALDLLCAGCKVGVLFGCPELADTFLWRRPRIYISRHRCQPVFRVLRRLAHHGLATHRIEQRAETGHGLIECGELVDLRRCNGPLTLVEQAHLQSDIWMRQDFTEMLSFRPATLRAVDQFAAEHAIDWSSAIFVHVRRGDYVNLDVLRAGPPTPPADYFRRGIARLQGRLHVATTIFVTDDADYVRASFAGVPGQLLVSRSTAFDLCVMSKCATGVMSPSSFSWWGAMLGPRRMPPVAPRDWLGWKRGIAFPARIISRRFDVIDPAGGDTGAAADGAGESSSGRVS